MANRIVSVHAGIYGMGIYAIMLPSSGFSVPHWQLQGADSQIGCHVCLLFWLYVTLCYPQVVL